MFRALFLTLVVLFALTGTVHAQAAGPQQPAPSTVAPNRACHLLLDVTTSIGSTTLNTGVDRLIPSLPVLVEAYGCDLVRVQAFSGPGSARFAETTEIVVPPVPKVDCLYATPPTTVGTAAVTAKWFPQVATRRKEIATERCLNDTRTVRAQAQAQADREDAVRRVGEQLQRIATTEHPTGTCTAVSEAIDEAGRRASVVIAVTDAADSCAQPATAPPAGVQLLVVQLPTLTRQSGSTPALTRRYPDAAMVGIGQLTPSLVRTLGRP